MRCCFVTSKSRSDQYFQNRGAHSACPSVQYPLEGSKLLNITGKVREMSCEIFYEEDNDHQCLSTMLLDAIVNVNVDLRSKLAENILIVGGTTMIPGFKARLKEELQKQLKSDRYKSLCIKTFKFHDAPSKENYAAWLGGNGTFICLNLHKIYWKWLNLFTGALYGSTELVSLKSLTKETYFRENRLPDWVNMKDNNRTL